MQTLLLLIFTSYADISCKPNPKPIIKPVKTTTLQDKEEVLKLLEHYKMGKEK